MIAFLVLDVLPEVRKKLMTITKIMLKRERDETPVDHAADFSAKVDALLACIPTPVAGYCAAIRRNMLSAFQSQAAVFSLPDTEFALCHGISAIQPINKEFRIRTNEVIDATTQRVLHVKCLPGKSPTVLRTDMFFDKVHCFPPWFFVVGKRTDFVRDQKIMAHNFSYYFLVGPGEEYGMDFLFTGSELPTHRHPSVSMNVVEVLESTDVSEDKRREVMFMLSGVRSSITQFVKGYDLQGKLEPGIYGLTGIRPASSAGATNAFYGEGYNKFWTKEELIGFFGLDKVDEEVAKTTSAVVEEVTEMFGM